MAKRTKKRSSKKTKKKATRRKAAGRRTTAKAGRSGGLASASVGDLQRELQRRQRAGGALLRRRDALAAKLADLNQQIAALGLDVPTTPLMPARRGRPKGTRAAGGGRRPRNEMNLVEALQQVLKDKTMGVSEVAEAVQAAGYRTSSPNFRTIVNQALLAKKDLFRKVARGQYTAK